MTSEENTNDTNNRNYDNYLPSHVEEVEQEHLRLYEQVKKSSVSGYAVFLQNHLDGWKNLSVRIAIVGSSGQGKSTLINTLRGLKPTQDGAAAVNTTECTVRVTEYTHPKNPECIYADLPGVGTPNFPKDRYMELIRHTSRGIVEFHEYDFFLLVSGSRFNENDLWLVKEIKRNKRMFYFIRTKIDIDLRNSKEDDPNNFSEDESLENLRRDIQGELRKCRLETTHDLDGEEFKIFLIGGKLQHYRKWDFPVLIQSLAENFPKLKRQAIMFLVSNNRKDIIKKKADILRNGVWRYVAICGLGGTIPIPFFSLIPDAIVMKTCYDSYRHALGLDRESLMMISELNGVTIEEIEKHMLASEWSKFFPGASAQASTPFLGELGKEGIKNQAQGAATKAAKALAAAEAAAQAAAQATAQAKASATWSGWLLRTVQALKGTSTQTAAEAAAKAAAEAGVKAEAAKVAVTAAQTAASNAAKLTKVVIPGACSALSVGIMYYQLHKLIDGMEEAAIAVLDFVTDVRIRDTSSINKF